MVRQGRVQGRCRDVPSAGGRVGLSPPVPPSSDQKLPGEAIAFPSVREGFLGEVGDQAPTERDLMASVPVARSLWSPSLPVFLTAGPQARPSWVTPARPHPPGPSPALRGSTTSTRSPSALRAPCYTPPRAIPCASGNSAGQGEAWGGAEGLQWPSGCRCGLLPPADGTSAAPLYPHGAGLVPPSEIQDPLPPGTGQLMSRFLIWL